VNGFAESLRCRLQDECLNTELFTTAPEVLLLVEHWRCSTTHSRCTQPSRGVSPWRQLNRELNHDHQTLSLS